ncbi:sensor domain-containing diguanylate cyclase [Pseudomonas sp. H9]|uniref:sensor domain-containing diguanylate cyclase n=1 Tax=Pseudomonas sp. H9 TaxID=483968 RepID=UPI0010583A42|nr:sensor domain-containing diguanylate cyclase [Pseudomonas sp. H9]TDF84585.1 diguanylate cyclase [Pseudomonas sp. H9]
MTQLLYIVVPWIGLGVLSILWVRALLRGRVLERRLRECRQHLDTLGGSQAQASAVQPDDIERYRRSQYFARIGTWDWDIDTEKLFWSDAIYPMFGYQVGEIIPSYERFCASVHPDDRAQVRAGELRCIATGENHDEEYRVVWPDGSVRWLRETGNVVCNAQGVAVKMMGVVRDITEEKAWANQLHNLAHNDVLTGLPNRLVFEQRLALALEKARVTNTRVALAFVDLNDFKDINDRHGHAIGDQVLMFVAKRLKQMLRTADTVARIGGDEFVLILEGFSPGMAVEEEVRLICSNVIESLAFPMIISSEMLQVGTSLGVAVYPDHAASMDTLIHLADLAMYEAKRSGDNQVRLAVTGVCA